KGLRTPPRDAVLAAVTEPSQRGRAFGFNRALDHLGAVLGSLAAWLLLQASVGVREGIGWSALPGVLAILVLLVALRGVSGPGPRVPDPRSATTRDAAGLRYWLPASVLVLLTVARLPETLLLLRLQQLGVPVAAIPLAWAALHVIRSSFSYPGGVLTDRI